jgi:RNA polymerase sigma-70 factor (ECF subfamily)
VKIWKGLPGFHGDAALATWIYTITRNTCLTELRKRTNRPTVSLHAPEWEGNWDALPALQTAGTNADAGMDVPALLAQLPDHYRQVVTLFYFEQKAYEEVADRLGIPMGTVKTYLYRAKKELLRLASRQPQFQMSAELLSTP